MKNKRIDTKIMMAAFSITHGLPFHIDGMTLQAIPQQDPTNPPCQECGLQLRCTLTTSKLCELADFVHAQSCILVKA